MALLKFFQIWTTALAYGIFIILYIIKQCFTKGFRQVFHWKRWDPPASLSDPSFGTHGFLTIKDVRIHYVASGPEDRPLMLFVHGFPEFWYSWRYQLREFQKDYRVVAIDQRGYNESSKPSGVHNYDVTKLMSDLEQVIPALGYKSCILVAHDWGGAVAWAFARRFPDLVDKLIIMNAPPINLFTEVIQTSKKQAKMSWYIFFFQLPYLPELLFHLNDFQVFDDLFASERKAKSQKDTGTGTTEDESVAAYKYVFSQPGALTGPINYYRAYFGYRTGKDPLDYDMNYTMPVLVIWGCQDTAIDVVVLDIIGKHAPKITVKRIQDASHFVQMDAPDEVNKFMREWLSNQ